MILGTQKLYQMRQAVLALLLWLAVAPAAAAVDTAAIDALLSEPALKHGTSGVLVQSLRDGRTIYSRNADKVFLPASNMKLLTTAAALDRLGPGFQYETRLHFLGTTKESVWRGNIYLKGGGDPTLTSADLEGLTQLLKKNGLRRLEGGVVADDTWLRGERLGMGWSWEDEQWYYAAPVSGLNLNGNSVKVFVSPARRAGLPAIVRLEPPTSYFTIKNTAVTTSSGESAVSVTRPHGRNVVLVSGKIALGHSDTEPVERISVQDPAAYAALSLHEALLRAGVTALEKPMAGATPAAARLLHTHESPPLSLILPLVNKPSDNTMAEILFRTMSGGCSATEDEVRVLALAFLKKIGGDPEAIVIADGSGLSRRNYISPRNMVAVLRYMNRSPNASIFRDSLPIAGRDGTLKNRMKGTAAEGVVRAKTGYLSQASALSGYLTTASGEGLAFSILMNNHTCENAKAKAVQDGICGLLSGTR